MRSFCSRARSALVPLAEITRQRIKQRHGRDAHAEAEAGAETFAVLRVHQPGRKNERRTNGEAAHGQKLVAQKLASVYGTALEDPMASALRVTFLKPLCVGK